MGDSYTDGKIPVQYLRPSPITVVGKIIGKRQVAELMPHTHLPAVQVALPQLYKTI